MIYVLIPTYNRPNMCARLVSQLQGQGREVRFVIADDGSTKNYKPVIRLLKKHDEFIQLGKNHGKRRFYKVINALFGRIRFERFNYAFKLDDDLQVVDGFFEQSIRTFEGIEDSRKMVLNLLADTRTGKPSWNGVEGKYKGGVWESGWIDMIWMARPEFFELFSYQLHEDYFSRKVDGGFWEDNPQRSSQVGKWLTLNFYQPGRFWSVDKSLVYHGDHESKLNPVERKRNPLKHK